MTSTRENGAPATEEVEDLGALQELPEDDGGPDADDPGCATTGWFDESHKNVGSGEYPAHVPAPDHGGES